MLLSTYRGDEKQCIATTMRDIAFGENLAAPLARKPTETTNRWANLALNQLCSQRRFRVLRLNICKIFAIHSNSGRPGGTSSFLFREAQQLGCGNRLNLLDFGENCVLHRTVHTHQRYRFRAPSRLSPT
jgi:hypothetical protein